MSAVATHGDDVADSLVQEYDALLPPERQLGRDGVRRMLDWYTAVLEMRNERLNRAELAYVSEQADDPPVREARDEATETLYLQLSQTRNRFRDAFGSERLRDYGLEELPIRQPQPVAEFTEAVITLLAKRPLTVTDSLGMEIRTESFREALTTSLATLRVCMDDDLRERRELEAARIARDNELALWTDAYPAAADGLTGLFRMAKRYELAGRIRPTVRRATGIEAAPADDADTTDSIPTDDSTSTDGSTPVDSGTPAK